MPATIVIPAAHRPTGDRGESHERRPQTSCPYRSCGERRLAYYDQEVPAKVSKHGAPPPLGEREAQSEVNGEGGVDDPIGNHDQVPIVWAEVCRLRYQQ